MHTNGGEHVRGGPRNVHPSRGALDSNNRRGSPTSERRVGAAVGATRRSATEPSSSPDGPQWKRSARAGGGPRGERCRSGCTHSADFGSTRRWVQSSADLPSIIRGSLDGGLGEQKAYARLDGLLPHGELKRWVADRPEFDVVPDGRGMKFIWAASGATRAIEDEPAVGGTAPDQSAPGPALALALLDLAPSDAVAPYDAQEWGRSRGRSWSTGVPNMVRRVGRCC